jgi:hypothetical protein
MEEKILNELKQIRKLLSEMLGTSDLPAKEKFSKEAISKMAKEFQKMAIERGEWVSSGELSKVIKHADWRSDRIIIEKLGFTNYFKRGHSWYFNRKDLVELGKELKARNINLEKYQELLNDQEKFHKLVNSINFPKGTKRKRHFNIPENLRDIYSKPYSAPTEELVRNEIDLLMEEYKKFDLSEYVDLFNGKTHGMFKYDYSFDRYVKPEIKKYCKDWCFKFNYANNALKKILELKEEKNEERT